MILASVVSVSGTIIIAGFTALATSAATQFVTQWQAAADRKRERYSQAVQTLVAWVEFPYRVRRRVDDEPATLSKLADLGHGLQESLAGNRAWVEAENRRTARVYAAVAARLNAIVGPAISDAWGSAPISSAEEMVLGTWGPNELAVPLIEELQRAVSRRFRWRL